MPRRHTLTIVPIVALGALVFALVNFLKDLSGRNWNGVITQLIAWVSGVAVVLIFCQTFLANTVTLNEVAMSKLSFWSQVFVGLIITSLLSTVNEGYKAIDSTQTASTPKLLGGFWHRRSRPVAPAPVSPPPAAPFSAVPTVQP